MEFKAIIPHMTNNNTPSPFVASTSNQLATYAPFNAFQDNTGAWISDVANSWIQIDLGRLYEVQKVYMDSVSGWTGAKIITFTLQGSKDGQNWKAMYSGPTTNYKYEEERNFGVLRFVRLTAHQMTMRGACVRLLQLYTDKDESFVHFDLSDMWVADEPIVLKGDVVAPVAPVDVRVLINDVVEDDWMTYATSSYSEYSYEPSLFKHGGNVITVQLRTQDGQIKDTQYIVYKLNIEAIKFNSMSYAFKIMNRADNPKRDEWIGQSFPFRYLNSESGVSYMFKYKPYAQMESRVEDRPRFFDKVINKEARIDREVLTGSVINTNTAIVIEDTLADISKVLDAVKSPGFKLAIDEARLIHKVFHAWGMINTERIGVHDDGVELAIKKIKIADDIISKHRLTAKRKNAVKNALTIIQGYEFGSKELFGTINDYYRAMDDVYPHKETIIAGTLLLGMKDRVKAGHKLSHIDAIIEESHGYKLEHDLIGTPEDNLAVVGEYLIAKRVQDVQYGIHQDTTLGTYIPDYQGIVHEDIIFGETGELIGIIDGVLHATKDEDKEAIRVSHEPKAIKEKSGDALIVTMTAAHKDEKTKDSILNDIAWFETSGVDAYIEILRGYVEPLPMDALIEQVTTSVNTLPMESWMHQLIIGTDLLPMEARNGSIDTVYVNKMNKDFWDLDTGIVGVDKLSKRSWSIDPGKRFVDKMAKDFMIDGGNEAVIHTEKHMEIKEGLPIFIHHYFENMWRDVRPIVVENYAGKLDKLAEDANAGVAFVDKMSRITYNENDLLKNVDKIAQEALIYVMLDNFNALDKVSIIKENLDFAEKIVKEIKDMGDVVRKAINKGRDVFTTDLSTAERESFDAMMTEQLLLDHVNLDAYIQDLIGAELDLEVTRAEQREGLKQEVILVDREISRGIILDSIEANRKNQEKESYVPDHQFVLAGDGSEWEDIWDRYSPGVDILDPPDEDYNYSNMAPVLYDQATGVPHRPIGSTNKPDVYVSAAMHHPIPDNSTFGVDETKRIAVDNYIFIDTVLALESIKNRNKLRYAGMPVGKTIKEVFSSLFTWIQQGAPGHKEYERMFRFARWYAEAVVLRQSKQILHRVYNPWQSTLHMGTGLGVDHTKAGWAYMTGTGTLNTTTLSAVLKFSKESYIDSEFVLRGYFDNPTGQGTMEIAVDGTVIDSFKTHGVYERRLEIPQGYHTYEVTFSGTSGSAAISSIEVGGAIFVSAYTSTDDSDVNGLKALNELMAQLLGYFELHHGGKKVKGTMEVRQRAVWNTHT